MALCSVSIMTCGPHHWKCLHTFWARLYHNPANSHQIRIDSHVPTFQKQYLRNRVDERVTPGLLRGRLRLSQYLVGCGRWDGRDDETTTRNRSYVDRAVLRDYC